MKNNWIVTDPSCNQMMLEIEEDKIYQFKEDRIVNPLTKEIEVFEATLNYDDYDWWDIIEACKPYGYDAKQVSKWIDGGEEIPLILECIFEQIT